LPCVIARTGYVPQIAESTLLKTWVLQIVEIVPGISM
jgi:hypothetical protein